MEYYFIEDEYINLSDKTLLIKGEEYKHLSKILGKKLGDKITLTNGKGMIYKSEIIYIDKGLIKCSIISYYKDNNYGNIKLFLLASILKNPTRFEFMLEKAVELGVYSIIPTITDNTVVKHKFSNEKLLRFNKISKVSALLSQRSYFPEVTDTRDFKNILSYTFNKKNKIIMYEFTDPKNEKEILIDKNQEVYLLIGPEGGFSEREVMLLKENNWEFHSLGDRKIRAETAAIISVYKILNNIS